MTSQRNKSESPLPHPAVSLAPVLSDVAAPEPPEMKPVPQTATTSSVVNLALQEAVVSAGSETGNSAGEHCGPSTGPGTAVSHPESSVGQVHSTWGLCTLETEPKEALDAGVRLDYDVPVPAMGQHSGLDVDAVAKHEVSVNPEYLEPVEHVPSAADDGDDLGFGSTLRFGTFAGIEDFGTSITLPGETSVTPETVISLDVVQEADEPDECGLSEAMKSVVENTLVQSSPLVEPPMESAADLEGPPAVELQHHQTEDCGVPVSSEVSLHGPEQAVIADAGPTEQECPPAAQEVCRDIGSFARAAAHDNLTDNKTDAATQVVEEPESQPTKGEPTYTSTGVQHAGYSMSAAMSIVPQSQGQEFKADKVFSTAEAQYGDGEVSDSSAQTNQPPHSQYGVGDFKPAESYEPRTDPVPTVPGYQQLPPQIQAQQQQKHDHPPPPPPHSAMSSTQAHSTQPRYVQPTASAQTENAGLTGTVVPSSVPHPPPVCGAPGVPIVRPITHMTQVWYRT